MARLFLAVWPPGQVVEQLRALPRPDQPGVRWVRPEKWHVTVRFLGGAEPADVFSCLNSTMMPAATAVLGPVVRRLARSTVVIPVAGLDQIAAVIGLATADIGEPAGPRPFHGHLTLARLRPGATCDLVGTPVAVELRVAEVVLVSSGLTHEGATYHVIGRWPTR
jgi:RNA 2',3'-cyclic 3'-phosphodiesterase